MSTLSTSIRLNDQMSATLDAISNATDRATRSWESLDEATSDGLMANGIDAIVARLEQMHGDLKDIITNQAQHARAVKKTADEANNLSDIFGKVKGIVGGLAIGSTLVNAASKAIDLADEMSGITARLNMMNDGAQTTDELFGMVYQAAQRSRGSVADMADVVARFGNNAKDAFGSNSEVVAFTEIVQKQMTLAGASTQEASNAILQLSQAMGSGVLRGDELNSIFEQAPNLIQSIADYLDVPIGRIREMASEGQLTADVVKSAIFASADEINAKFEQMPMTFGQIWQQFQNTALDAFRPVLAKLTELANSEKFQKALNIVMNAVVVAANLAITIFDKVGQLIGWVNDKLLAMAPSANSVFGVITGGCVVVGEFFRNLGMSIVNIAMAIGNAFTAVIENIGTVFWNVAASVIGWWYDLLSTAVGVVEKICAALNALPFISFDYSGITAKADEYAAKSAAAYGLKKDYTSIGDAWSSGMNTFDTFGEGWAKEAFKKGVEWGDKFTESVEDSASGAFDFDSLSAAANEIANNTADTAKALNIANEDIKYLRDLAEKEAINKFTTSEVKVELGGVTNTVSQNSDMDGFVSYLAESVRIALEEVREGVDD